MNFKQNDKWQNRFENSFNGWIIIKLITIGRIKRKIIFISFPNMLIFWMLMSLNCQSNLFFQCTLPIPIKWVKFYDILPQKRKKIFKNRLPSVGVRTEIEPKTMN